ncbi:hypothetical protein GCM10023231_19070 [Olivibacter ginsenosidimutans]|uniref:DoxX family protein n=1 Tax=Olivibacter ginsenosidimutans TaxID=1176537 RepID=A0ABP9B7J1_9SPHI
MVVPWFALHVLQLEKPITVFTNGSGDTTYDYVAVLVYVLLALVVSLIWSFLDRKASGYPKLQYWLSVFLRYYLAMFMFIYGFIKIFHLQMPSPSFTTLIQEFGDKSPMGLAWSYVGYSKGFSFFTGFAEVVAGFFLLFRKTTTLGALLTVLVTVNILAINLFFDVPVKLFSSVLLLMSLFLLSSDTKRVLNFFICNKPADPVFWPVQFKRKWMKITRLVLKILIIGSFFYSGIVGGIRGQNSYGDKRRKPPLYGLYDTEAFILNGDTIAPLMTDTNRWKNLIIEWEKNASVKLMNNSLNYYNFTVDTVAKTVHFFPYADTSKKGAFRYELANNYLILRGNLKSDSIQVHLKKREISSFRLMNTGFRWINEYPYNR